MVSPVDSNRLDRVLRRFSMTLEELSYACSDVQTVTEIGVSGDSHEAVVKAQALDRITQTLACLSEFSAAISELSLVSEISVGQNELDAIHLPSVRHVLEGKLAIAPDDKEDISLF